MPRARASGAHPSRASAQAFAGEARGGGEHASCSALSILAVPIQDTDALARIAAAVTPAVMVSACGLLALGLDNQAARMTGRLRDLAREYRGTNDERRRRHLRSETRVLSRRHALYTGALLANYAALASFLLSSATALAFGATFPGAVLALFGCGVVLLLVMAVSTLLSVRMSRHSIVIEEREVLRDSEAPPSSRAPE
jgi:hypothetical protein